MTQPTPAPDPQPTAQPASTAAPAAAPATTAAGTAPAPAEEVANFGSPQVAEAAPEEDAPVERVLGVGAKGDINNPSAMAVVDPKTGEVVKRDVVADDNQPGEDAAKAPAKSEETP